MSATADTSPSARTGAERAPRPLRLRARVWRITAGYALFAVSWIYFSDRALALLAPDPPDAGQVQYLQGPRFRHAHHADAVFTDPPVFAALEKGYRAMHTQATEIRRMNQLYAALSRINQAIVTSSVQDELIRKVCRVLVDNSGFRMALGWSARSRVSPAAAGRGIR